MHGVETLAGWVRDARARTLALLDDLDEQQLAPSYLPTLNPFLWEACHLAYFQENWVLRHAGGESSSIEDADDRFDSTTIEHERRWQIELPGHDRAREYLKDVRDRVLDRISRGDVDERLGYLIAYSVFHEDMHTEALTYMRQALGYAGPSFADEEEMPRPEAEPIECGDVIVVGGVFRLGADREAPFVFDNEKWAREIEVAPFAISRLAVTEGEIAAFVDDDGYMRRELWSVEGWGWRRAVGAMRPVYWNHDGSGWLVRRFDRWRPLDPARAAMHLSWHEAEAFCRWAGRRLPTEAEWEVAAGQSMYPWGDGERGSEGHAGDPSYPACLDWEGGGAVDVRAHASGDSAAGCRQMLGNVWEWTSSVFAPYPGFEADMYHDYSTTSFGGSRRALRGGSWSTRSRNVRNTWRNFFTPDRRDVFSGLRTCAISPE